MDAPTLLKAWWPVIPSNLSIDVCWRYRLFMKIIIIITTITVLIKQVYISIDQMEVSRISSHKFRVHHWLDSPSALERGRSCGLWNLQRWRFVENKKNRWDSVRIDSWRPSTNSDEVDWISRNYCQGIGELCSNNIKIIITMIMVDITIAIKAELMKHCYPLWDTQHSFNHHWYKKQESKSVLRVLISRFT